jgi:hypothetical protein
MYDQQQRIHRKKERDTKANWKELDHLMVIKNCKIPSDGVTKLVKRKWLNL